MASTRRVSVALEGVGKPKDYSWTDTIEASVSSNDKVSRVRQWKDKAENLLAPQNPYWIEIQMIGSDQKTANTIPLQNGYFEMRLPKILFEGNPESITIEWIDFYR